MLRSAEALKLHHPYQLLILLQPKSGAPSRSGSGNLTAQTTFKCVLLVSGCDTF